MKIRKQTVVLLVLLLIAALFILRYLLPRPAGELRCALCGRPATHRIKLGSWIAGLCDSCYAQANAGTS